MKSMKKNQIILLVVILLILIFGGIFYWSRQEKAKLPPEVKVPEEEKVAEEIFSLSAVVSRVDAENNFLIVNPREKDGTISTKEIKVILSEDTKLLKLEFPFDPKNPPKEATFTPELVEVTIEDFKKGDPVFIKTNKDITGKTEIGDVNFIHILP